jgi:hypothetical protein
MSTDPRAAALADVLAGFDSAWGQIRGRRVGITADEYRWEPNGIAPGAVPTIAWREWHIGADCLDSYSSRLDGAARPVPVEEWPDDVDESWREMERAYERFRGLLAAGGPEWFFAPLGAAWGPFAKESRLALALHALHEVSHHGAEIALLRDLWAARV